MLSCSFRLQHSAFGRQPARDRVRQHPPISCSQSRAPQPSVRRRCVLPGSCRCRRESRRNAQLPLSASPVAPGRSLRDCRLCPTGLPALRRIHHGGLPRVCRSPLTPAGPRGEETRSPGAIGRLSDGPEAACRSKRRRASCLCSPAWVRPAGLVPVTAGPMSSSARRAPSSGGNVATGVAPSCHAQRSASPGPSSMLSARAIACAHQQRVEDETFVRLRGSL